MSNPIFGTPRHGIGYRASILNFNTLGLQFVREHYHAARQLPDGTVVTCTPECRAAAAARGEIIPEQ